MKGTIVSRAGDKTVVLEATKISRHPLYGKKIVRTRRYLVHDPENKAQVGDVVTVKETRPLSARKRWVLVSKESGQ
jgi:small subunit ribosomal protein S17